MLYNVGMPDAPRIMPVPAGGFANMGIKAPETLQSFYAGQKMDEELAQREALAGLVEARLNPPAPSVPPAGAVPLNQFAGIPPAQKQPVPQPQGQEDVGVDPQIEAYLTAHPEVAPTVKLYSSMADIVGGMEGGIQTLTNAGIPPEVAAHIVAKEVAPHYVDAVKNLHAQGVIGDKDLKTFNPAIDLPQLAQKTKDSIRVIAKHNPVLALSLIDKYSDEGKKQALNQRVAEIMGNPHLDQAARIRALESTAIQYGAGDISTILSSERDLMRSGQMERKLTLDEKKAEETARQNRADNAINTQRLQLQIDKLEQMGKHQDALELAAAKRDLAAGAKMFGFTTADNQSVIRTVFPNGDYRDTFMPKGWERDRTERTSAGEEKRNNNADDIKALPLETKQKLHDIVTGKTLLIPAAMKMWVTKFANSGMTQEELLGGNPSPASNATPVSGGTRTFNPATGKIE